MNFPARRPAWRIVSPGFAVTSAPSILNLICEGGPGGAAGAGAAAGFAASAGLPAPAGLRRLRLLLVGLLLVDHALPLVELSAVRAAVLLDVRLELVTELREVALGRPREGLGEDADRLPRRLLRDRLDRLEVLHAALAVL